MVLHNFPEVYVMQKKKKKKKKNVVHVGGKGVGDELGVFSSVSC